jgi:hypothetical protein
VLLLFNFIPHVPAGAGMPLGCQLDIPNLHFTVTLGNKQKISTENHYRKARAEARAARGDANDPERCVLRTTVRRSAGLIADGST